MKDNIVVVSPLGECYEVLACFWGVLIVQLDADRTLRAMLVMSN